MEIEIVGSDVGKLRAIIDLDENPKTARVILDALPIEGVVNRWGDEIYFSTSLQIPTENGRELMERGDLAFWPPGQAICLFFGPTPVSDGEQPRAASAVNRFGKVLGDATVLRRVAGGAKITLRRPTNI
ncbi:MAG: cyclophilin-like fold protein [Candidatus Ranarchaeia archaeon]